MNRERKGSDMSSSAHQAPAATHLTVTRQFAAPAINHEGLAAVLDSLDLPREPPSRRHGRGRPRKNHSAIARSLVARAVLALPTTTALVGLLRRDPQLRQACGWQDPGEIPSLSTFSRLAPEVLDQLPEQLRAQVGQFYPDHPLRVPAMSADHPPAPEIEPARAALRQLSDAFVALAQDGHADLSLRQLGVLLACHVADGPLTIRALQQQIGLDKTALKHTLDRLDRLRLTTSTRDRRARRRYLVLRTRRGTEFLRDFCSPRSPRTKCRMQADNVIGRQAIQGQRLPISRKERMHLRPEDARVFLPHMLLNALRELISHEGRDLTARQLGILLICYLSDEPQTVRSLAAQLGVSRPVVSRALDRLASHSLARRVADHRDRRSILVQRTAEGWTFLEELADIVSRAARTEETRSRRRSTV